MPDNDDQAKLDQEDAQLRLNRMTEAIRAKDAADEAVRQLQRQLAQAKRRVLEAEWNLSLALSRERRASQPKPEETPPAKPRRKKT